uniref:hypothetical protein n=1 Tax=Clostridium sp. TaxID=1506 RepID=UPI0026165FCB
MYYRNDNQFADIDSNEDINQIRCDKNSDKYSDQFIKKHYSSTDSNNFMCPMMKYPKHSCPMLMSNVNKDPADPDPMYYNHPYYNHPYYQRPYFH